MIKDLTKIQHFAENKNIVLLGNSRSILTNEKVIDSFDVVCRINRGKPEGKEKFIGSRTDILFLATRMREPAIKQDFNPNFVVWTTECQNLALPWVMENAIQNPVEDWRELRNKLPALPSTGYVTINFLLKHINFKSLTIYGFTFFDGTGTWYHRLKKPSWHNGDLEKKIILKWTNEKENVRIIKE